MVASSLMVIGWIGDSNISPSEALPGKSDRILSFEDRFILAPMAAGGSALRSLQRSAVAKAESEFTSARNVLATRWPSEDFRPTIVDEPPPPVVTKPAVATADVVPLPRSRPAAADQVAQQAAPSGSMLALTTDRAGRPADRTLLQKLSDLMPPRLTLASLAPGGGLLNRGPDLASLGYDEQTAVYDISARAVYMPNRVVLEAHSGLGNLRDDPDHVSVHNLGATPPAIYELKPREKEFHGVSALRMIPADGSDIGGRSGLLVHSFMLGPNGDSNGCISIKDYDRFLKAFNDGEVNRIVVVPSLKGPLIAAQSPT